MEEEKVIKKTKEWVKDVVIGLNLCPFASSPFKNNQIFYYFCPLNNLKDCYYDFLNCLNKFQQQREFSTCLFITPHLDVDFQDYLSLTQNLQEQMENSGLSEYFQLVCFHPFFLFSDLNHESRAHYVNRSPFPLIHILQTKEVELAIKEASQGESISKNNEKLLNKMTKKEFENRILNYIEEEI